MGKKNLFLILFVLLALFHAKTNAQVWKADPNESTDERKFFRFFQTDKCSGNVNASETTETDVDGTTGKSWKVRSPLNVRRAEYSRTTGTSQNFTPGRNKNFYYAWRWRIAYDTNVAENDQFAVFQWKTEFAGSDGTDGSQNHPITLAFSNNKLSLNYFAPCKINNNFRNWGDCKNSNGNQIFPSARKFVLKEISVKEEEWIEIVLRIQRGEAETGDNAGKVQLWINGSLQQLNDPYGSGTTNNLRVKTDDAVDNKYTDDSVYPKWGIYASSSCNYNITTWINNLAIWSKSEDALNSLKNSRPDSSSSTSSNSSVFSGTKNLERDGKYLQTSGANLVSSTSSSGDSKKFTFISRGNDEYNINPKNTGFIQMILESGNWRVRTSSRETGSSINKYLWKAERLSNGNYRFKNKSSDRYLTIWASGSVGSTTSATSSAAQFNIVGTSAKAVAQKSAEKQAVSNISIYPNPVNDKFTIRLDNVAKPLVTITNMLGKIIYNKQVSSSILELSKNDGFSSGIYFLSVTDANQNTFHKKFIIN